jgi:hypothetical protein
MRPRPSRQSDSVKSRAPAQTSLSLSEPPARLLALLREHDRLLEKIGTKKTALAGLSARLEDAIQRMTGAQPITQECGRLDHEIHAVFAELLARKRQQRGTRRLVATLYQMLQNAGILSSHDPRDGLDDGQPDFPDLGARPFGDTPGGEGAPPPSGAGGYSARRPGDASANQSVRGLFRDLATALHPDKVHDEAEKSRRTEVMKEISRAYEEGDLARLLDLKRIWMTRGDLATGTDDLDHRCAKLERMNVALRGQLDDLTAEVKELRRSPPAQILRELERSIGRGGQDPVAAMLAGAQEELECTRELRDFVVSFRDGKITVDEFMRGPPSMRRAQPADEYSDFDEEGFNTFVESLLGQSIGSFPPRRRTGRRPSKRGARPMDVPF